MEKERRKTPRFQFIAPAELVNEKSGERLQSWVADLGLHGCSLSIKGAPRRGTIVSLKIGHTPRETVLAKAVTVAGLEWDAGSAHSARYDAERSAALFCLVCNRLRDSHGLTPKIADHDREVVSECDGGRVLVQGWHGERPRSGTNACSSRAC